MSECTVLGLKEELGKENISLIDVRQYAEYAGGRVEGAKLVPLDEIEKRHQEIDHTHTVYVMCRSGRRSAEAQKRLKLLGFQNVVNVKGGFEEWKKENLPFEKDEKAPWALERQVRFTAGLLVLTGVLLSIFVHPYFIGLAGFVGAGLTFAGATDWCGMAMLLAKMPWNQRQTTCETNVSTAN
ncbi:MAG: rhodanese-like domain-containing protein [Pyrinomonadaceae bacterium]|nr:rhodanese-like domain-containing protein [Pyrinomonadaceae bacterium]